MDDGRHVSELVRSRSDDLVVNDQLNSCCIKFRIVPVGNPNSRERRALDYVGYQRVAHTAEFPEVFDFAKLMDGAGGLGGLIAEELVERTGVLQRHSYNLIARRPKRSRIVTRIYRREGSSVVGSQNLKLGGIAVGGVIRRSDREVGEGKASGERDRHIQRVGRRGIIAAPLVGGAIDRVVEDVEGAVRSEGRLVIRGDGSPIP